MATEWLEKAKRQAEAKAKKTADGKKEKKGFFKRLAGFFRETKSEFKKIVWPTKKDVFKNTAAVIAISILAGAVIWIADAVFSLLVALVF